MADTLPQRMASLNLRSALSLHLSSGNAILLSCRETEAQASRRGNPALPWAVAPSLVAMAQRAPWRLYSFARHAGLATAFELRALCPIQVARLIVRAHGRGALVLQKAGSVDAINMQAGSALERFLHWSRRALAGGARDGQLVSVSAWQTIWQATGQFDLLPTQRALSRLDALRVERPPPPYLLPAFEQARRLLKADSDRERLVMIEKAPQIARVSSSTDFVTPSQLKHLVQRERPISLVDARWLDGASELTKDTAIAKAYLDDEVQVAVTAEGLLEGESVTFTISEASSGALVEKLTGRVAKTGGKFVAASRWVVPEEFDDTKVVPGKTEFRILAESHERICESRNLQVEPFVWELMLQIDPDDPEAQDDELILIDADEREVERLAVAGMAKEGGDWVRLRFEGARRRRKYSLLRDHGPDEGGGVDVLIANQSPQQLEELAESCSNSGDPLWG